jgi:CBS domain containing-hemolysin-like protein
MNSPTSLSPVRFAHGGRGIIPALVAWWLLATPREARASLFEGEALDQVAEVMSWIVIIIVPVVAIAVFWLVHILPEKVAEKRKHPQAKAIQCLCLLSLFFGGLLWPIAWLWAYSKPVLYKLAYGTDKEEHHPPPDEPKEKGLNHPAPVVAARKKEGGLA